MGIGACCKQQGRVDTLKLDEINSSSECSSVKNLDRQFSPRISSPGREGMAQLSHQRIPQFGNKQQSKSIQSYSFITLQSEQHFNNLFTFQLMPSQKDYISSRQLSNKPSIYDDTGEFHQSLSMDPQSNDQLKMNNIYNKIL